MITTFMLLFLLQDPVDTIKADDLKEYVTTLADDDMEGRAAGTAGGRKAAEYIAKKFKDWGLDPIDKKNGYFQKFKARGADTENVIGILEGSDEKLKKEIIVIGGHYDHIGKRGKSIYNGADDDASGTSVMMEVAQAFAGAKTKPKRTIVFIAFGAEEMGLLGSKHYVKNPIRPIKDTVLMINLEMMGRGDDGKVTIMRYSELSGFVKSQVDKAAKKAKLKIVDGKNAHLRAGDQWSFHDADVPILCLYGGENHPDYHRATDTSDKIRPKWMQQVARMTYLALEKCVNEKGKLDRD